MNKNKIKGQYRQGDILIEDVMVKPSGIKAAPSQGQTLAYGEVTGHAHVLDDEESQVHVPISAPDEANAAIKFAKLGRAAKLKHQEHAPIPLKRGWKQITRQREYSPEAIRQVAD